MLPFQLLRQAERELELARQWYDEQRYGLGLVFFDAYEDAVRHAQEFPEAGTALVGPELGRSVRKFPLQGFPFYLVMSATKLANTKLSAVPAETIMISPVLESSSMTDAAKKLLEAASALPEDEGLALASELIASLDGPSDGNWESAWLAELDRRVEAARDRGDAPAWSEVRARVLSQLAR
jgi:putative addiction module component (TIGR02574 family)